MSKKTKEKVINLKKDKQIKRGKVFYLIFSLIVVGVLAVSGLTIWLVSTLVGNSSSYVISVEQVAGGEIVFDNNADGVGSINVVSGSDQTVKIIPDNEHYLKQLIVNGEILDVENYGQPYIYAITNIKKAHNISAVFGIKDFGRITITQLGSGAISPSSVSCNYGTDKSFTITPSEGHKIESITIDEVAVNVTASEGESQTYTFTNVQKDYSVHVTFVPKTYWITVEQKTNGSISPNDNTIKYYGTNQTFTITPSRSYKILSLIVDGEEIYVENEGEAYQFTFGEIQRNHTISANYVLRTFVVMFLGYNDEVIDSQEVTWDEYAQEPGEDIMSAITLPEGYHFVSWSDDLSNSIRSNKTVRASFTKNRYNVVFKNFDGTEDLFEDYFEHGYKLNSVIPSSIDNYRFDGWFDGVDENKTKIDTVTSEMTLYAQYIRQYYVNVSYEYPYFSSYDSSFAFDIGIDKALLFSPRSGYALTSMAIITKDDEGNVINEEIESISIEYATAISTEKYLTGKSITKLLENISNNFEIYLKFAIGPAISSAGWEYEVVDDKYYITAVPNNLAEISWNHIIPSQIFINSTVYDVYGIGDEVSSLISNLKSYSNVIIENGISVINDNAFSGCSSLKFLSIPASIVNIGENVFAGCSSLQNIIIAEGNVSYAVIGGILFNADSTELIKYFTVNVGEAYSVPNTVITIKSGAFADCINLKLIEISASVEHIGENAFTGCTNLESIEIENANTNYAVVDGVLFNSDLTELIRYPSLKAGSSYQIPASVITLSASAFADCINLTAVTFENAGQLNTIGDYAFYNCKNLTKISLPSTVTSIGSFAFNNLEILMLDFYAENVPTCSYNSFGNNLVAICVDGSLLDNYTMSWSTFTEYIYPILATADFEYEIIDGSNDIIITEITASQGKYFIDSQYEIDGIIYYVKQIGDGENCVDSDVVDVILEDGIEIIANYAFYDSNLTNILMNTIAYIGDYAFSGCASITSIDINSNVISIGDNAFNSCFELKNLNIEEGLSTIGDYAFAYCHSLVSVTLPSTVTSIGNGAFYGSQSLMIFVIYATEPPVIGDYILNDNIKAVCIPTGSLDTYKTAWEDYSGYMYEILTSDEFLYEIVEGTNEIIITEINTSKTSYYIDRKYVINETTYFVKSVGQYQKNNSIIDQNAISVCFADGIEYIGRGIFKNSANLISVIIASGTICQEAFSDCRNLISVVLGPSIVQIDSRAFYNCANLIYINIDETSLESIGDYAFSGCMNLTSITIVESVTIIGQYAFESCSNLTEMTVLAITPPSLGVGAISDSVTTIYVPIESIELYESSWSDYSNLFNRN